MIDAEWRNRAADALIAAGLYRQAAKLRSCRDPDHFAKVLVCGWNPEHYQRIVPFTCKLRICPKCNEARKHGYVERFLTPTQTLLADAPAGYSCKFVTFTTPVPVTSPVASVLLRTTAAAVGIAIDRVLLKHTDIASRAERNKGRISLKGHGIGYVLGAEFGEQGARLHHHVTFVGPDLPQPALVEAWSEATNGLATGVWIKRVLTQRAQLKTTLEYTTKVTRLDPEYTPDLFRAYRDVHRVRARGAYHGLGPVKRLPAERCPECLARVVEATRRAEQKRRAYTA